jgi:exodeoxyribonuclease V alpha subunit
MDKKYIKGNYRKSIFRSDKGYLIGLFKVRETNDNDMQDYLNKTVTFTGYFDELNENDTYTLYGAPVTHPRYGFQYQVSSYERVMPEGIDGLVEFLSSDLFKGVGVKLARKIVDTLGTDTLTIIKEHPEQLNLVPGLNQKKANSIIDTLNKYNESHDTIVYLCDLGFAIKDALNIYNLYKVETIARVKTNIYLIIDDIDDISFKKIDEIAMHLNMDIHDERRVKACILYTINNLTNMSGNTYLTREEIYSGITNYLKFEIGADLFEQYLNELNDETKIYIDKNNIYAIDMYEAEQYIANKIHILNRIEYKKYDDLDKYIDACEVRSQITYNEDQRKAIKTAMDANISIITGGPGTGKTTIIKAITEVYQEMNHLDLDDFMMELALLAPTGRAAKRMSESTLLPASTIHRFLHWDKESNEFNVNEDDPSQVHLVIIDEVSMIDTKLLDSLFRGLLDNVKIVMVGDYDQLPSVGPGQVLKDLIESDIIPIIHLNRLYRQSNQSYIPELASEIKNNDLGNYLDTKEDYEFEVCDAINIRKYLHDTVVNLISQGYTSKDIQVMAPMYRGENGIDNLNSDLQNIFNPKSDSKAEIHYADVVYRLGDKILELINMPDDGVFNGDIGIINNIISHTKSDSGKDEIYVDYDGNVVKYYPKDLANIKHGFAISIHKSQGGEFPIVVMPITRSYYRMLYRKLIYTGITRAKKKLIMIGEPNAFVMAVSNTNEYTRRTGLLDKLKSK